MSKPQMTAENPPAAEHSALLTDLYQLTMLQGYLDQGMTGPAVFEFFVRKLPRGRNFLVAAGLEQVLEYLQALRFGDYELRWLRESGRFGAALLDWLQALRFTGEVHAVTEGTLIFPDEPLLRVIAPLPQAQLVESRIINLLHFQTLIASKAVRSVLAAPGAMLVDFGMRRAHGAEAGLLAARAAYIAGFTGTATVLAAPRFGIPVFGTMAHSFVQAHDDELTAFEHFARSQPHNAVLLIDTYDVAAAARKVVALQERLRPDGIAIKGVRIDSGDLLEQGRMVRRILDEGGCGHITIFASSSLDEHALARFAAARAPIDGYGVGTLLDTSADRPWLDCAYKLQEYAGLPRRKRSAGKATWPGRKQVFRLRRDDGRLDHDILTVVDDACPGTPLLHPVMRDGRRLHPPEDLETIRARVRDGLAALPPGLRRLDEQGKYEVRVSQALRDLADAVDRRCGA